MNSNSDLLDASDPATSSTSTSRRRSTSTVRPRNRRLVSFNEEREDDGAQSLTSRLSAAFAGLTPPQSRGTTPSPFASRRSSPLPAKHPSRATDARQRSDGDEFARGNGLKSSNTSQGAGSNLAAELLESSWSSLQSLASSFLGSDPTRSKSGSESVTSHKRRKPSRSNFYISSAPKQTQPSSWGPAAPAATQIGAGTKEERQALVQAKKREVLLLANGDSVSDLKGRYKRRDSAGSPTAVDPEQDEEALVYIHHVQPTDSMTGVTIKYGCQLAVLRKANGFWPSDSIQSRKVVLLPVEACSVKGRRVRPTEDQDLLGDGPSKGESLEEGNTSSIAPSGETAAESKSHGTKNENDRTWKHEAWVQIEGFPAAVEIGRVPRRTLGFFPRTRRKSQSRPYTDAETPSPSFDTSRPKRSDSSAQPPTSSDPSLPTPPDTGPGNAGSRRGHRRNRSSICLVGPGGVGTLDRDVTAPGPAPDGLNKFVSQHLPHLTVPPPPGTPGETSVESTASTTTSSTTGLENVGGAIEGWMRKMASRAKAGLAELQQSTQPQPGQAVGIGGLGDLIELDDGLEGTASVGSAGASASAGPRRSRHAGAGTGTSHSHSHFRERYPSPSVSATSRARATGAESGMDERLKGD
ncbi:hypothetical protein VTN96DRAFT_8998 [Rasamsonia emersonii]